MLLTAALAWGTNPMVMKLGFRNLDPYPFNTLRLVTGVSVAAPIVLLTRAGKPIEPGRLAEDAGELVADFSGLLDNGRNYSGG